MTLGHEKEPTMRVGGENITGTETETAKVACSRVRRQKASVAKVWGQ